MSEPLIMPIRHGSLSPHDKKKLADAGVIVIEHDDPAANFAEAASERKVA